MKRPLILLFLLTVLFTGCAGTGKTVSPTSMVPAAPASTKTSMRSTKPISTYTPTINPLNQHNVLMIQTDKGLYHFDLKTLELYEITPLGSFELIYWSNNGSQYIRNNRLFTIYNQEPQFLLGAENKSKVVQLENVSWSHDDSKIVFNATRSDEMKRNVFIFDFANKELTSPLEECDCNYPVWSPDDSFIAFRTDFSGTYQLHLLDLENREITQITDFEEPDWPVTGWLGSGPPQWSPDGTILSFWYSSEYQLYDLYTYDLGLARLSQLTENGEYFIPEGSSYDWSFDNSKIVFTAFPGHVYQSEIYLLDIYNGEVTRLTFSDERDTNPIWVTENSVVFFSEDDMKITIHSLDLLNKQEPVILFTFPGKYLHKASWIP